MIRSSATKAWKYHQQTPELLEIIHVLWTSDNGDRSKDIWRNADVTEVVPWNKQGVILLDIVFYSKLAIRQKCLCEVEYLKPRGAPEFLWTLDRMNYFNNDKSVWIFLNEVEPDLDPLVLQKSAPEKLYMKMIYDYPPSLEILRIQGAQKVWIIKILTRFPKQGSSA